ncbi:hypothetical protein JHV675_54380 [Mycobacterium avium subsp. hominissuis]
MCRADQMHSCGVIDPITGQATKVAGPGDRVDHAAGMHLVGLVVLGGRPVIVHVVTRKGMGYAPAEDDEADQMHSCGVIDPITPQECIWSASSSSAGA